jgi:hypothetical protein
VNRHLDNAWNLVDMARGLIPLGKEHDLLGEALDELSIALAAGAQSAETNEDLAQSEGRQSGGSASERNAQPSSHTPRGT